MGEKSSPNQHDTSAGSAGRGRKPAYAILATSTLIVILLVGLSYQNLAQPGSGASTSSRAFASSAPTGTQWFIGPASSLTLGPMIPDPCLVSFIVGNFTATSAVDVYSLNNTDYAAWTESGAPPEYTWTVRGVTSFGFDLFPPPGNVYLTWYNPSVVIPTAVNVTSSIFAEPSGVVVC